MDKRIEHWYLSTPVYTGLMTFTDGVLTNSMVTCRWARGETAKETCVIF